MRIKVPYGKGSIPLDVDDRRVIGVIGPNEVEVGDEEAALLHALENPLNSLTFGEFLRGANDVLFIVNDGTRLTPTSKILKALKDEFSVIDNVRFLIATGAHRRAKEDECIRVFGGDLCAQYEGRISSHDSKADAMADIGTTRSGVPVQINRKVIDADRIVIISSVEPHYFGGFTGGRKSILPGVASYESIEKNHALALQPGVGPLALEGNPVHENFVEALELLGNKPIFSIQVVLSNDARITTAFAGNIHDSFYAAAEKARNVFAVPIESKADIIVSVAPPPMDANLLQLQKPLNHGKLALKEGGILILVGACPEGIGGGNFFELMEREGSPENVIEAVKGDYKLGYHIAYNMAETSIHNKMFLVSELPDDVVKTVFMQPFNSVQEAVDAAIAEQGDEAKVLILPYGSLIVPHISG